MIAFWNNNMKSLLCKKALHPSVHGTRHAKYNEWSTNNIPYTSMNLINCWHPFSGERWLSSSANPKKGEWIAPSSKKFKSHFKDAFMVKPWRVPKQRLIASSNTKGMTKESCGTFVTWIANKFCLSPVGVVPAPWVTRCLNNNQFRPWCPTNFMAG